LLKLTAELCAVDMLFINLRHVLINNMNTGLIFRSQTVQNVNRYV
jgi:hypothetical protein